MKNIIHISIAWCLLSIGPSVAFAKCSPAELGVLEAQRDTLVWTFSTIRSVERLSRTSLIVVGDVPASRDKGNKKIAMCPSGGTFFYQLPSVNQVDYKFNGCSIDGMIITGELSVLFGDFGKKWAPKGITLVGKGSILTLDTGVVGGLEPYRTQRADNAIDYSGKITVRHRGSKVSLENLTMDLDADGEKYVIQNANCS